MKKGSGPSGPDPETVTVLSSDYPNIPCNVKIRPMLNTPSQQRIEDLLEAHPQKLLLSQDAAEDRSVAGNQL